MLRNEQRNGRVDHDRMKFRCKNENEWRGEKGMNGNIHTHTYIHNRQT